MREEQAGDWMRGVGYEGTGTGRDERAEGHGRIPAVEIAREYERKRAEERIGEEGLQGVVEAVACACRQ